MYGVIELKYKGRNPAVFGLTALGAGLGAVMGLAKGGLPAAFLGMLVGGTLGLLAGYLLEQAIEELSKMFNIATTSQSCRKRYIMTECR